MAVRETIYLQSDECGVYDDERLEESMDAVSGESDAYQFNDTIALETRPVAMS